MNKEEFLKKVELASHEHLVTEKELLTTFRRTHSNKSLETKRNVSNLIYIVASVGAFFILGWVLYIASLIWADTGVLVHLAMTLGIGLLLYVYGNYYLMYRKQKFVGMAFQVIAAPLLPFGFGIVGEEISSGLSSELQILLAMFFATVLLFMYAIPNTIIKSNAYYFATVSYISAVYFLFMALIFDAFNLNLDIYKSTLIFSIYGFIMLFIGNYLDKINKDHLAFLVRVGGLGSILGFNYALVYENSVFNITQIAIVLYLFLLAVYKNNKLVFYAGIANLIMYVFYVFFKLFDFNNAFGLLLIGVVLIALSFGLSKLYSRVFKE
jgi:hypothetical protein